MRLIQTSILTAILSFVAIPLSAQPSFDCGGRLNPTELTICKNTELARLDRGMAERFYRIYGQFSGDPARAFRRDQTRWRRDRDACGAAIGCIKANYVYRLGQFAEMAGGSARDSGPALTRQASARVLADGTIERRQADGSLTRHLPNGGIERYAADGQKLPNYALKSNVQNANLPPLPPLLQSWGETLETSLSIILDNILTDQELAAYRATESSKDDYVLIDWRIRSISLLTLP